MFKRTIVGAVLIVLMGVLLWFDWRVESAGLGGLPLAIVILVLVSQGYLELSRLAAGSDVSISRFMGMACTIMVATLPFWGRALVSGHWARFAHVIMAAVVLALFADQIVRYRTAGAIKRVGVSLLAVCYLGVCGAVVLDIRMQFGVKAFVLFLLAVKATDIGAYFTGSAFGRHKIAPSVSPGKTWEGLVGGLVFSAAVAVGFVAAADHLPGGDDLAGRVGFLGAACFAAMVGLFGQIADMCESTMKRDAGIKDAGTSAGPFGGVLDMIDSPLLAAPVAYVVLAMLL
ncbi:MAG: phosphatidate cytidylyltransferase [Planctomycetota bacterium]|nr:phosphatidate cytidylyltransferase [Planctomycetota bacterium]